MLLNESLLSHSNEIDIVSINLSSGTTKEVTRNMHESDSLSEGELPVCCHSSCGDNNLQSLYY